MSADRAPDQPRQCQAVEPPILTVTGRGGEHQGQIARFTRAGEPPLQCHDQFVWSTDADKTRAADAVAVANQRDRFVSGDNLVFHSAKLKEEVNLWPARPLLANKGTRVGTMRARPRRAKDNHSTVSPTQTGPCRCQSKNQTVFGPAVPHMRPFAIAGDQWPRAAVNVSQL